MGVSTLYHYCNLDTFLSIMKNKTIRLSDVNKSNDFMESKSVIEYIKKATIELCHKESIDQYKSIMYGIDNESTMRHLIGIVLDRFSNYSNTLIYATCFSEERDYI